VGQSYALDVQPQGTLLPDGTEQGSMYIAAMSFITMWYRVRLWMYSRKGLCIFSRAEQGSGCMATGGAILW
jgi:hypothetical protein